MPQVYSTFIGPEGAKLPTLQFNPTTKGDSAGLSGDLRSLSDDEIRRQIAVAQGVDSERGMTADEKNHFFNLQNELKDRQSNASNPALQAIQGILGGDIGRGGAPAGPGAGAGGPVDFSGYEKSVGDSNDRVKQVIADIFNQAQDKGTSDINADYGAQRRQAIEEQGALGFNPNMFAAGGRISNIEGARNKALSDLFSSIASGRGSETVNAENNAQNRILEGKKTAMSGALSGAQLGQTGRIEAARLAAGAIGQGQDYGLKSQAQIDTERQTALDNLFRNKTLDMAAAAGKAQADAEKPSIFGQVIGGISGLGGLAGGVGGLLGGLGTAKKSGLFG